MGPFLVSASQRDTLRRWLLVKRRRERVWILSHLRLLQRHLRPRHRPLREGDNLPRDRREEGKGRQRRVVSVRRHVGRSGRRSALQLGITALHIKLRATGGNRTKT